MRQLPWTCVEASPVQQICFAPAASSTSRQKRSARRSARARSAGSRRRNARRPYSSTTTAELLSSFASASSPTQWRNPRTASTSRGAPERPALVAERRREGDRVLDRRRLDHEAAVLVVLEVHAVGGDRIDHVRVLRLVEEAVDEAHRMQAEVPPDRRALVADPERIRSCGVLSAPAATTTAPARTVCRAPVGVDVLDPALGPVASPR